MVVRRRGALMGVVSVVAFALGLAYLWRFGDDRGLVPFLLGVALLAISLLHAVAWRASSQPLLDADMTGLRVRLGGQWAGLPWNEVESVEVSRRRRLSDGLVTVRAHDERRVLVDGGHRVRLAVALNRWLYDAALVVPFGLTTTSSTDDIVGTLERLADGRAEIVIVEEAHEPVPTVEVAAAGTLIRPDEVSDVPTPSRPPEPRRIAAVVSALREGGRRGEATVPIRSELATLGALALSERAETETEPLPELSELRRRAPEDDDHERAGEPEPQRSADVELVIDATTDLSSQAMRRVRDPQLVIGNPPTAPRTIEPAAAAAAIGAGGLYTTPPEVAIGTEIRRAREWLDISVDDLAERTRIRPYVIESIEVGDFSPCGGDFYARGHLRMLASILGIDPEPIIASYDVHLATAPVSPRAVFDAELSTGMVRSATSGGSRWAALVAAVLVLILVWGVARFFFSDPNSGPRSMHAPTSSISLQIRPAERG